MSEARGSHAPKTVDISGVFVTNTLRHVMDDTQEMSKGKMVAFGKGNTL